MQSEHASTLFDPGPPPTRWQRLLKGQDPIAQLAPLAAGYLRAMLFGLPGMMLFVNVRGARACGLQADTVRDARSLRRLLRRHGLPVR